MLIHGATLNGVVNPGNAQAQVGFEWTLPDPNGGSVTIVTLDPISGGTDIPISFQVLELDQNVTISFRAWAENSLGRVYGEMLTFTTLVEEVLPTVTTLPATNIV